MELLQNHSCSPVESLFKIRIRTLTRQIQFTYLEWHRIYRLSFCPPTVFCKHTSFELVFAMFSPSGLSICELPVEVGDCSIPTTRYFFNSFEGTCEPFQYSGCGGNANNFYSMKACLFTCGNDGSWLCNQCDCGIIIFIVVILLYHCHYQHYHHHDHHFIINIIIYSAFSLIFLCVSHLSVVISKFL